MPPRTRPVAAAAALLLLAMPVAAQRPHALLAGGTVRESYAGGAISITSFHGIPVHLLGGRAGWMIDHRYGIGLTAMTTLASGDVGYGYTSGAESPPEDRVRYAGIEAEYLVGWTHAVHGSVRLLAAGGDATFRRAVLFTSTPNTTPVICPAFPAPCTSPSTSSWPGTDRVSDRFTLLEPAISAEVNATRWLRLSVGASYRLATGLTLPDAKAGSLSGRAFTIGAKFGSY